MRRLGHHPSRARAQAGTGERGAIIVEFSLVALLLVTLLAGAYDYGSAWRVGLAANEAARAGARVGSGQGNVLTADFSLLTSMKSALDSSKQLGRVTRVVVFRSTTANGAVPATCKSGTGSGEACNILTGAQFRALAATSGGGVLTASGCINNSDRKGWCPTARNIVQATAHYLGVWVQVNYDYLFPMLGGDLLVERTAVMRLEPKDS